MSQSSKVYAREESLKSLDLIAVYNPTSEDFTFWSDRYGDRPEKTLVPKAQRDVGHGKGIAHLPRYKAKRYATAMITQQINKIANDQLKEIRKENRKLSKDERLLIEKDEVIRTNDTDKWKELSPTIWLGLVRKFGGDVLPDPVEITIPDSGDPLTDAMKDLKLGEKVYEPVAKTTTT